MSAYYNENDPKAAAWLRELIKEGHIAPGDVDERSIVEVQPNDLKNHDQCHFFAGIGGWSLALRLAGISDTTRIWTGSCPCQPFSSAGKQRGTADERHLWPQLLRLIAARRPQTVFGEQVASSEVVGTELEASFVVAVREGYFASANKLAKRLVAANSFHYHPRWLDGIRADLEQEDYTLRDAILGAHSVGAPQIRQRLFWMADARRERDESRRGAGNIHGTPKNIEREARQRERRGDAACDCSATGGMGIADSAGRETGRLATAPSRHGDSVEPTGDACGLGHAESDDERRQRLSGESCGRDGATGGSSAWSDSDILFCLDGKARRVESGTFPLAYGLPGRVGLLRGYGNAIVPQVAATFIKAALNL